MFIFFHWIFFSHLSTLQKKNQKAAKNEIEWKKRLFLDVVDFVIVSFFCTISIDKIIIADAIVGINYHCIEHNDTNIDTIHEIIRRW